MTTKAKELILYMIWLCLYILCVGLGTVDEVKGMGKAVFILTSLIFFLPGILLLLMGIQEKNRKILLRVRITAICSLALTVCVFCLNLFFVGAGESVGLVLHDLLNLVSAPMFCSQYWIISLFCWACLLSASFQKKG